MRINADEAVRKSLLRGVIPVTLTASKVKMYPATTRGRQQRLNLISDLEKKMLLQKIMVNTEFIIIIELIHLHMIKL
jgi:hypothetical protein